jgi:hypothetical protein
LLEYKASRLLPLVPQEFPAKGFGADARNKTLETNNVEETLIF